MPSVIHHGSNSVTSSLFTGPLSYLDQEAGLHTFSVHEELTLKKGTRLDTDYMVVVGDLMRLVLQQESAYKESLLHAVNKGLVGDQGQALILGYVFLNLQEKASQVEQQGVKVLEGWEQGVKKSIPHIWGEWRCWKWAGHGPQHGYMDIEIEHGEITSEVFEALFEHLTTLALTFNSVVVHGEMDTTLILAPPMWFHTLRQVAEEKWDKHRIIHFLPHLSIRHRGDHPDKVMQFRRELDFVHRLFWDVIQALVGYQEGDGTIKCLTPNSQRLLEHILGEQIDEHTEPYPENEHSFPRPYANEISADTELNQASKAMAKSLWNFVESVSADQIRTWVENKHTEESLSCKAKWQLKAEKLKKTKEDSVSRARAHRSLAQLAQEAKQ